MRKRNRDDYGAVFKLSVHKIGQNVDGEEQSSLVGKEQKFPASGGTATAVSNSLHIIYGWSEEVTSDTR